MNDILSPDGELSRKLREGRTCVGIGVTYADPLVSETVGDALDFIWLDLEHVAMSFDAMNAHLLAARSRNISTVVRVADGHPAVLKPILDAGADGIILAQVETVDEVRRLIDGCLYRPVGRRGMGPRVPMNYGRANLNDYLTIANTNMFVSVMIETAEAAAAIDQIVALNGLTSIVIGPFDLSGSLGLPGQVEHPKVVETIDRVIAAARKAGVFVGCGMPADPAFARRMIDRGVNWLQLGGDFEYLRLGVDETVRAVLAT